MKKRAIFRQAGTRPAFSVSSSTTRVRATRRPSRKMRPAFEQTTHTAMEVPVELVPAVRELIAKGKRSA
jgi:hypothetical protein